MEQQFIFAIDIKGIKHLKPLFTYLTPCPCFYLSCTNYIQRTNEGFNWETHTPLSHTMADLHVEVQLTVMRKGFFLHIRWKRSSTGGWLILASHPVCFQSNLLAKSQVCMSVAIWLLLNNQHAHTKLEKEKKEGDGRASLKSIPHPFWSCLTAEGEGSHQPCNALLAPELFQCTVALRFRLVHSGSRACIIHYLHDIGTLTIIPDI